MTAYQKKRSLQTTRTTKGGKRLVFVVQKHAASHLHYDFRLEIEGVLKSWAIPKGPSLNPKDKRLAVLTDDHPLDYKSFEGVIPKGHYGAGTVLVWDQGYFKNIKKDAEGKSIPLTTSFHKGRIEVYLEGKKLKGGFALIRMQGKNWLLIKMKDKEAKLGVEIVQKMPLSVLSNRTIEEIEQEER